MIILCHYLDLYFNQNDILNKLYDLINTLNFDKCYLDYDYNRNNNKLIHHKMYSLFY